MSFVRKFFLACTFKFMDHHYIYRVCSEVVFPVVLFRSLRCSSSRSIEYKLKEGLLNDRSKILLVAVVSLYIRFKSSVFSQLKK